MEYLPIQEFTDKWKISNRRIQILCRQGRINGAKMIGNMWIIPENAVRPADARIKSPIIHSAKTEESNARKGLKKLLNRLFKITEEWEITENEKKTIVLSEIASGLCAFYLNKTTDYYIKKKIYHDLSGTEFTPINNNELAEEVFDFIEAYKQDHELDNLLSWAYQYTNKIRKGNVYSQTQFFTEKYMINYLVANVPQLHNVDKIVDPCAGGGNFLTECLDFLSSQMKETGSDFIQKVLRNVTKLYGYDIDCNITRIALVNIRLRVLAILNHRNEDVSFTLWDQIRPNIFKSSPPDYICGSLSTDNKPVIHILNGHTVGIHTALGEADVVLTNPPFATVKGMSPEQKDFLKKHYPDANCDMCVSFFDIIHKILKPTGFCGIVSQNSWMHLKTFKKMRARITSQYCIYKIVNLGSGAFQDLSGEKSNVSLLILGKEIFSDNLIDIMNLNELSLHEKTKSIIENNHYIHIPQKEIDGVNGYDFSEKRTLNSININKILYKDIAVPMQGTSTGNAKELVGYFWEHFGNSQWIRVSNGGGYCRWQGLNDSVVKWGKDAEYIKAQKGSALRNVKYFPVTQMVFSDTGTAGLNVRMLLDNQIFIASGPGIRITKGNKYAHLALLNSRLAAYYIKSMSPKLTIAAGYIGQIPVAENIYTSVFLEKKAKLCIELKQKILSVRPNNLEYDSFFIEKNTEKLETAAWEIFNEDITNELLKLQAEAEIDRYICSEYGLSKDDEAQLSGSVGQCAYSIKGTTDVDLTKLDKYIAKLIDASCSLKRTRASKNSLGCDGIIEYIAKDLMINPQVLISKIQETPYAMKMVLEKYQKMLLHNAVLYYLGYNVNDGITADNCKADDITNFLITKFGDGPEYGTWIKESFNSVHNEIFKGIPYLIYKNGVIQKYGN